MAWSANQRGCAYRQEHEWRHSCNGNYSFIITFGLRTQLNAIKHHICKYIPITLFVKECAELWDCLWNGNLIIDLQMINNIFEITQTLKCS